MFKILIKAAAKIFWTLENSQVEVEEPKILKAQNIVKSNKIYKIMQKNQKKILIKF